MSGQRKTTCYNRNAFKQNAAKKRRKQKLKLKAALPAQSPAEQLFQGQRHPKKQKKLSYLDQWIEVRIVDGKTVTTLYPPNDLLIERGQRMLPPPDMVYRRLNFPDGIPAEYAWTAGDDAERLTMGGMGIQRMTVDMWLEAIANEALRTDGHIGPTDLPPLPRPEQHGACNCPACTAGKEYWDAHGPGM